MPSYKPARGKRPDIADVDVAREKSMLLHDQSATLRLDSKRLMNQSKQLRDQHQQALTLGAKRRGLRRNGTARQAAGTT